MKKNLLFPLFAIVSLLTSCNTRPQTVNYDDGVSKINEAQVQESNIEQAKEVVTLVSTIDGFVGQGIIGVNFDYEQNATLNYAYYADAKHYQETDSLSAKFGAEQAIDYADETLVYYEQNTEGYIDYRLAPHAKLNPLIPDKAVDTLDVGARINSFLNAAFLTDFSSFYTEILPELANIYEVGALNMYRLNKEYYIEITFDDDRLAEYLELSGLVSLDFEMPGLSFGVTSYQFSTLKFSLILDSQLRGRSLTSEVLGSIDVTYQSDEFGEFISSDLALEGTIDIDVIGSYTRGNFDKAFTIDFPTDLSTYDPLII
ncbi:MAG TPA: hypothetical protein VJZ05_04595 [Bacilli bacterium]|jgi:hypothetical protein|nr:hypothetical protein [Bacilli bacterium]MDD4520540.1 hypothetical protein [Bacilli bacterium]MDY0399232.1 hypothetical protein [Bacilli bacterium]HKM11613.1 hypothetical protein [Bacilli bacterium]